MRRFPLLALGVVAAVPAAQAQSRPPIRPLGPVVAKTTAPVGLVTSVRALPGGRVLLNDALQRRVVLLDSTLANATVVADTTAATGNAYGGRIGGLIPFRGDSTLFVDAASMSMLVIDPNGKVGRTLSVPRAQDANALVSAAFGTPGFDAKGRLVYRSMPQFRFAGPPPGAAGGSGAMPLPEMPDSAALVRVDLATRAVDTVGFVKTPKIRMQVTESGEGRRSISSVFNPLPQADDWAVLSDGTIAIVRGRDYHLDLVTPDGTTRSAAKVPFDWQRLTDEQKVTFMDSVKAQRARMGAVGGMDMGGAPRMMMQINEGPGGPPPRGGGERRVQVEGGMQVAVGGPPGAGGPSAAAGGAAAAAAAPLIFVDPSELPDYRPPFLANSARADAQGNVWIRTTAAATAPGALVYDVVNAKGELVDRVQVPAGRQIMGFGPDGSVFLMAREGQGATATTTLERARIR
ncbi:hypothetical protein [Roseisolibacter agri]|uniref:Phytase-like domain-containing protein n=1 Tax=Roseisolibacter agri TaxID=2014610 RepID=A0AA37QFY4_9BACT|nr:hypothetical protein [Roseisolibacter agri]GLC25695.1 hypothetical protein rosag_22080 [Roseisolibacter agri]